MGEFLFWIKKKRNAVVFPSSLVGEGGADEVGDGWGF
jgi:hypothetical protein